VQSLHSHWFYQLRSSSFCLSFTLLWFFGFLSWLCCRSCSAQGSLEITGRFFVLMIFLSLFNTPLWLNRSSILLCQVYLHFLKLFSLLINGQYISFLMYMLEEVSQSAQISIFLTSVERFNFIEVIRLK